MSWQGDFQSGACTCHRSTDYDAVGGADDYEATKGAQSLINGVGYSQQPSTTATQRLRNTGADFDENNMGITYDTTGGKRGRGRPRKKKSTRGKRTQKGGQETSGATPRPMRYYDGATAMQSGPSMIGNRDVGTVDLVPRNAAGQNPFRGGFTEISQTDVDNYVNGIESVKNTFYAACDNLINIFESSQAELATDLGAVQAGGSKQEKELVAKAKEFKKSLAKYQRYVTMQRKKQQKGGNLINKLRAFFVSDKDQEQEQANNHQQNNNQTAGRKKSTKKGKSTGKKKKATKKRTTKKKKSTKK